MSRYCCWRSSSSNFTIRRLTADGTLKVFVRYNDSCAVCSGTTETLNHWTDRHSAVQFRTFGHFSGQQHVASWLDVMLTDVATNRWPHNSTEPRRRWLNRGGRDYDGHDWTLLSAISNYTALGLNFRHDALGCSHQDSRDPCGPAGCFWCRQTFNRFRKFAFNFPNITRLHDYLWIR